MITDKQLALIAPNCTRARRRIALPHLQETMRRNSISTPIRAAAFLANLCVESGEFRYTEEIWDGRGYQATYDTGKKAISLGNTPEADGDGKLRKGYGLIQTTGGRNQRRVLKALGLDPEQDPKILGEYPYAALSAGFYWRDANCNRIADQLDGTWDAEEKMIFRRLVKAINGGVMHLAEREFYYRRALQVFRTVPGFGLLASEPQPAPVELGQGVQVVAEPRGVERIERGVTDAHPAQKNFGSPAPAAGVDASPTASPAQPAPAPTAPQGPAGTLSNATLEERAHQTKIIDFAAQQVTPEAAKDFAKSGARRAVGPTAKLLGYLGASLQAGSIAAWLGTAVFIAGAILLLYHYRKPVMAHVHYAWAKLMEKFA